jgi:hypothetical protein
MANVSILWNKPTDSGVYSQGGWLAGLPLGNLVEADVRRVARSTGVTAAETRFRVDLGAVMPVFISDFVLLQHNLTTAATIRFVVTDDATDAAAGARTLDTGALAVWEATVLPGARPWGLWPWAGIDPSVYPSGTAFFHRSGQAGLGRYLWCYIADAANPAGYVEIGRFMAGAAWSPRVNASYGASIRWVDPSEAKRTRGGRRIVTARPRFRQFEISLGRLSQDEAFGVAFEIDRQLGKGGNFYLVMDPAEPGEFRYRRSIYAALVDSAPIAIPRWNAWAWQITAEELI